MAQPIKNLKSRRYYPSRAILISLVISIVIVLAIIVPIILVYGRSNQIHGTSSSASSSSPDHSTTLSTTTSILASSRHATTPSHAFTPVLSIPKELWGYHHVRPGAHMFWWFHGYRGNQPRSQMPLILWLSGGPGDSSVGSGSFGQVGPINLDLKPRNQTWIKHANMLFIDYPIGTGFSYADDMSAYCRSDDQVVQDLYDTFAHILRLIPPLQSLAFHFVGESYGGKIGSIFANKLLQAKQQGQIQCNLVSCILSSPFISATDMIEFSGPYLNAFSLIDTKQSEQLLDQANKMKSYLQQKRGIEATSIMERALEQIVNFSNFVNLYDVVRYLPMNPFSTLLNQNYSDMKSLENNPTIGPNSPYAVMNKEIRQKLGIIPKHVSFATENAIVYVMLRETLCYPSLVDVEVMLKANVSVLIANGQFDGIINGISLRQSIKTINWEHMTSFQSSKKTTVRDVTGKLVGFIKRYRNLAFMNILGMGHSPNLTTSIPHSYIEAFKTKN